MSDLPPIPGGGEPWRWPDGSLVRVDREALQNLPDPQHSIDVETLLEAIRLTQEYAQLPAVEGWSWYDTYRRYRPRDAARLRREWEAHRAAEIAAAQRAREQRLPLWVAGLNRLFGAGRS